MLAHERIQEKRISREDEVSRLIDWRRRRGWWWLRRNDCSERDWWPKWKKLHCMPNVVYHTTYM